MENGDQNQKILNLYRITGALAAANRELLTAEVLMHDRQNDFDKNMSQLLASQQRTDAQIASLNESRKGLDERMDKLVIAIGELIQRLPPRAL